MKEKEPRSKRQQTRSKINHKERKPQKGTARPVPWSFIQPTKVIGRFCYTQLAYILKRLKTPSSGERYQKWRFDSLISVTVIFRFVIFLFRVRPQADGSALTTVSR